jgi:tRNA and rRNA cytosine-C5-methylases
VVTNPQRRGPSQQPSPRTIALDAIVGVLDRRQPLNETLERHSKLEQLTQRDRAFARLLSATTLRRLGQIDALIDHALSRPLPTRAGLIHHILRLGVCQLAFLGTPAHAAVDTSVALCRQRRHIGHAAFVNAVLRRLAAESAALVAGQDAPRLNAPAWLWDGWCAAYGDLRCRAIAEAHLDEPPVDLTPRGEPDPALIARLGAIRLPTGSLRLAATGPVTELPGFADGSWWVQDAAAAIPALLLGNVRDRCVVDLCSAPGGKSAQLAAAGARVIAVDRSPTRLDRVRENLRRLNLEAITVNADATNWQPVSPVDDILLDAPCSSTGTIRRHPDIPWLKSAADVNALALVQEQLLHHALSLLVPGSRLVYCVCSLQPEEGPRVVERTLAATDGFARDPIRAEEIGGLGDLLTAEGDLRTLPSHLAEVGGLDGFYAARLISQRGDGA